jgi:ribose-phosphate pyrophosphokinase
MELATSAAELPQESELIREIPDPDSVFITGGSTYPELTEQIARYAGLGVGAIERKRFADTSTYARFLESVRDKHVVLVQACAYRDGMPESDTDLAPYAPWTVDNAVKQLDWMVDAAVRASAEKITVVVPLLPYARMDRKVRSHEPIEVASWIRGVQNEGASRIVTLDPHSPQVQGVFHGPFDQLTAAPLLVGAADDIIKSYSGNVAIVAADAGRAKTADEYSVKLNNREQARGSDRVIDYVPMRKKRERGTGKPTHLVPDNVDGVLCIITEDMIDTGGTMLSAVAALEKGGAAGIVVVATHGIFSPPALEYGQLVDSPISQFIVTDTVPVDKAQKALGERLIVQRVAPLIGQAVVEIVSPGGSVSRLFERGKEQFSQYY